MGKIRFDVVHRRTNTTPSIKNLRQGLEASDVSDQISFHGIRPNAPSDNILSSGIEYGLMFPVGFWTATSLSSKSDCLIIHKPLSLLDSTILERVFLRFDKVVYSTYDAEYVEYPRSAKLLFKKSDLVYATSHAIVDTAQKYTSEDHIAYIPPSIDTEFFRPDRPIPQYLQTDSLVLGWVGNADIHDENLLHFLNNIYPKELEEKFVFRILGGGSIPNEIQNKLDDIELETDVIDFVPWEDVPRIIGSFDIGVAPLRDTPFNRGRSSEKIREYMACGVPVVASNVGENPYLIPKDGGRLVNNADEWNGAINFLSSSDKTRKIMGKNAREHVVANYSIPAIANRINDEFEWLF